MTAPLESGKYAERGYRVCEDLDMIIERDVGVELRDGTRIFVNVYRPVNPAARYRQRARARFDCDVGSDKSGALTFASMVPAMR